MDFLKTSVYSGCFITSAVKAYGGNVKKKK